MKRNRYLLSGLTNNATKYDLLVLFNHKAKVCLFQKEQSYYAFVELFDEEILKKILEGGLILNGRDVIIHEYDPKIHDNLLTYCFKRKREEITVKCQTIKYYIEKNDVNLETTIDRINELKKSIKYPPSLQFKPIIEAGIDAKDQIIIKRSKIE